MLKKVSGYALALVGLTLLFSSCKKDYESIQSIDSKTIQDYLTANNITAIPDPNNTGFYYQIINPGTGDNFKNTDSVFYTQNVKSLKNGTSYISTPVTANEGNYVGYVSRLATGVQSGITVPAINTVMQQLKPGGSARIFLPSYLAFGKNGVNNIPSNENIDFVINTYSEKTQWQHDDNVIKAFIAAKGLTTMIKDPSRVYYSVSAVGTGTDVVNTTSTITAKYTGRLLDGSVFDFNTTDAGVSFSLPNGVIQGWALGIPAGKLKVGGKIRLLIPSGLAYGTQGSVDTNNPNAYKIPPNAVLDFDIEIVTITN